MSERGTRWPENQSVPLDWIEIAYEKRKKLGLQRINLVVEAVKFANYWASKSGKGATHVRWPMVWMNWALNGYGGLPEPEPNQPKIDTQAQRSIERVKLALRGIRSANLSKADVTLAVAEGKITEAQAKGLGL